VTIKYVCLKLITSIAHLSSYPIELIYSEL